MQQCGIIPKDPPKVVEPPKVIEKPEPKSEPKPVQIDINLLVRSIEEQLRKPLDVAIEDILIQDDTINVLQFNRKLIQQAGTLDKIKLNSLTKAISNNNTGKLDIK